MQSRPYEKLRIYYFDEPATNNTVNYYDCYTSFDSPIGGNCSKKFVYQHKTRSKRVLSAYSRGNCILKILCYISGIKLKSALISKLIDHYWNSSHDCNYFTVFDLFISYLEKIQCRLSLNGDKFQSTSIKIATQNVQNCVVFWLQYCLQVHLFLLKRLRKFLKVIIKSQTSYFLNGSDMEVDDSLNHSHEKSPVIKEETIDISYESEYPTVIKNFQNMKEPECAQVNNSFNCVNHNDNLDNKYGNSVEMVANGDVVNCHTDNSTDSKLIETVNCAINEEHLLGNIKKEVINGTDFKSNKIIKNEPIKEETIQKEIKEKNEINCNIKSNDCSIDKEKNKPKDSSGSSSTSHSLSSKKSDESWSHHSSSSSSSSKSKYKDYKSSSHRNSSSSKSCSERSRIDSDKSKHDSSDKKKSSRNCHHKSDEKCHCKSHHHSRHHSKSKKYQSVKTQCTADEIAYELRGNKSDIANSYFTRVPWVPHPQLVNLKYGRFYRLEVDRNGGASVVHLYMDEIRHLTESQMKECAVEFIKLSYSEDENDCAYHVMGIVHGAAAYLPDLVDYMADHYPTLTVKTGSLASRDNHTTTMSQYRDEVYKTYSNGTFRYAPLDQLSICGVLGEEVGAYFPDFVARLEQSPFMKPVMPWSSLSVVETDNPRESNDGPIFWVRPGEQMLPANEALKESARPKKRRNNELDNLAYIAGSRSSEARESLFMDRTKAHADQVGVDYGLSNTAPTAAVGVLKSVNCGHPEHGNRATKDVVAFHAQDYNELLEILMLDLYEPPQTQCTKWLEVSKLNTLRREGIRYAHVQLHDNDVYYLPRKIIHQFQTISSVASVAWHIRYKDYFSIMGAPNLHTPTGINKGQVFYEKKNVAVYYPPVSENDLLASVTNPGSPLSKTPKKFEKLKDYSPFKHSPRKNHKVHSPRASSKKEKESDPVPQKPDKKESESASNGEDKKSNVIIHKDQTKSVDEISSKRERDSSSSKKSDRRDSSGSHSSSKKERKDSQEAGQRKEVKNLEFEFDSVKRSKMKSSKSKSDREERRSNESKSESKHKRRDESKSNSHSKHEKSSSHKKSESTAGNSSENSSRSKEKQENSSSLKRRNSESHEFCSKRLKEENRQSEVIVENGKIEESCIRSEDEIKICSNSDLNFAISNCVQSDKMTESNGENEKTNISFDKKSESSQVEKLMNIDCESKTFVKKESVDLMEEIKTSRGDLHSLNPELNPPLPSCSPPLNPPLPPNSPLPDGLAIRDHLKEESSSLTEGNQNHQDSSKIKNVDMFQGKKLKKKIIKKENESYDLLGDIMSQMDKKK